MTKRPTFDLNKSACEVLKGVKAGNQLAEKALYKWLWDKLNYFIFDNLNKKYHDRVGEIFQDAYLKFWSLIHEGKFEWDCSLSNDIKLKKLRAFFRQLLFFIIKQWIDNELKQSQLVDNIEDIVLKDLSFENEKDSKIDFNSNWTVKQLVRNAILSKPDFIRVIFQKYYGEGISFNDLKKEIEPPKESVDKEYDVGRLKKRLYDWMKIIYEEVEEKYLDLLDSPTKREDFITLAKITLKKLGQPCHFILNQFLIRKSSNTVIAQLLCEPAKQFNWGKFCTAEQVKKKKSACLKKYYLEFPENII